MTSITIPDFAVVALVGASGSGKSTFAGTHFLPTEVLSSDTFRGMVSDDEGSLEATQDAFDALHHVAGKRLARRRLTVVDATSVQSDARRRLVTLAREYHALSVAIVFDLPRSVCLERNRTRSGRNLDESIIGRQCQQLRRSLKKIRKEGFHRVYVLNSEEEVAAAEIVRARLWTDRRDEHGPFDIIGDVHGCYDELCSLLTELGYSVGDDGATPPAGRRAIFLGDLGDRGPKTPEVMGLVMTMVAHGTALCVPGNHDVRLKRALRGAKVMRTHGLEESLEQLQTRSKEFRATVAEFLDDLVSHYVLDDDALVVAHAGMREDLAGRASAAVRHFAVYGDPSGATDDYGLPVRNDWAAQYRGSAVVVYGHTPVGRAEWLNDTINIDTGCVFGGSLTALRYPERDLVSVPAARQYCEPIRPFLDVSEADPRSAQHSHDDVLDISDVSGQRRIETALMSHITVRSEQTAAALEVMSRFAVDPKWLVYLPPTMAPGATSSEPGLLEHPDEAFQEYRREGTPRVVCQEKHMGSRAVVVLCRDEATARERFGVDDGSAGVCYTRTGRRFFDDAEMELALLDHVRSAATKAGLWEELGTTWLVFDGELMPWSAKALPLIRSQYAAVGAAARADLGETARVLGQAAARGLDVEALQQRRAQLGDSIDRYVSAYRQYCWPVDSVQDLRFAPFHLLASEAGVHTDHGHHWHLETLGRLVAADPTVLASTDVRTVELEDPQSCAEAVTWWLERTEVGSEGMVIKPADFIRRCRRGLLQPGIKCRGREYLRIIYGPDYTRPERLESLRGRTASVKRNLALREFALGVEGLSRFVAREPLRRVHECVFGVLALESEPVDPRL